MHRTIPKILGVHPTAFGHRPAGLVLAAGLLIAAGAFGQRPITYVRVTPEGVGPYDSFWSPLLSPDGSKVVFSAPGANDIYHIYSVPADGSEAPAQIGAGEDFDSANPAVFWTNADASVLGIDSEDLGSFTYDVTGGQRFRLGCREHYGWIEVNEYEDEYVNLGFECTPGDAMGPWLTADGYYAFCLSDRPWGWEEWYTKNGKQYWRPTVNADKKTLLWRAHFKGTDQDPDVTIFGNEGTGFDAGFDEFAIASSGAVALVLSGQNEVDTGYFDDYGHSFKMVVATAFACRPGTTTQLSASANYGGGAAVSSDGQWVAYTENAIIDWRWLNNVLVVSKTDGSEKHVVFTPPDGYALDMIVGDPDMGPEPFWDADVHVIAVNADGSRILFKDEPMRELYVADRGRGLTAADWGLYRISAPGFSSATYGIGISDDGTKVAFKQRGDPNADPDTESSKLYIFVATVPTQDQPGQPVFTVDHDGVVFAKSYATSRADFAEYLPAAPGTSPMLEPGDVLALAADGAGVVRAGTNGATGVVGVYSTAPGLVGGTVPETKEVRAAKRVPVAVVGIVPVKVTAEDGPIRPGALLGLSRSAPGRLGVATPISFGGREFVPEQAVLGKALEPLEHGDGTVRVRLIGH